MNFHIVYHPSYQVPTLYFNGYDKDNKYRSIEEIYQDLDINKPTNDWTYITQMIHPILNYTSYCLHPCNTSKVLNEILNEYNTSNTTSNSCSTFELQFNPLSIDNIKYKQDQFNLLFLWFSLFGQFVHIYIT